MPTPKKGARLGGSASNQKKILANLAAQLIIHEKLVTTDAKARMLRPYVEKLITKAKSGTVADRRQVARVIQDRNIIFRLFNELAPQFEGREGGYTRIIKVENRRGDNAPMSQISLVLEAVAPKAKKAAETPVEAPAETETVETVEESVDTPEPEAAEAETAEESK